MFIDCWTIKPYPLLDPPREEDLDDDLDPLLLDEERDDEAREPLLLDEEDLLVVVPLLKLLLLVEGLDVVPLLLVVDLERDEVDGLEEEPEGLVRVVLVAFLPFELLVGLPLVTPSRDTPPLELDLLTVPLFLEYVVRPLVLVDLLPEAVLVLDEAVLPLLLVADLPLLEAVLPEIFDLLDLLNAKFLLLNLPKPPLLNLFP